MPAYGSHSSSDAFDVADAVGAAPVEEVGACRCSTPGRRSGRPARRSGRASRRSVSRSMRSGTNARALRPSTQRACRVDVAEVDHRVLRPLRRDVVEEQRQRAARHRPSPITRIRPSNAVTCHPLARFLRLSHPLRNWYRRGVERDLPGRGGRACARPRDHARAGLSHRRHARGAAARRHGAAAAPRDARRRCARACPARRPRAAAVRRAPAPARARTCSRSRAAASIPASSRSFRSRARGPARSATSSRARATSTRGRGWRRPGPTPARARGARLVHAAGSG